MSDAGQLIGVVAFYSETAPRASEQRAVLIIEPDTDLAEYLLHLLSREGLHCLTRRNGTDAIDGWAGVEPSVVLLDYDSPDPGGGLAVCRRICGLWQSSVIMLARSDGESAALASFDAGADDYVHQLYRPNELAARVRAAMRRTQPPTAAQGSRVVVGDVELDVERHVVRVGGRPIILPLREFRLLHVLLSSPGKTWTRAALMRRVWGETPASGTKSLDVHVKRIRMRIEDDPAAPTRILTVRGVGYQYARAAAPGPPGGRGAPG